MMLVALIIAASPTPLELALARSLQRAGASVEVVRFDAPRCTGALEAANFEVSGRVAVKVRGAGCEAWGWAQVKVTQLLPVLLKPVPRGGALAGAYAVQAVEPRIGQRPTEVPADAVANRPLRSGEVITDEVFDSGPALGSSVPVQVRAGALVLEQRGVVRRCAQPGGARACVSLPSGKVVDGEWSGSMVIVRTM